MLLEILPALGAAIGTIMLGYAAIVTSRSVGKKNGHGSVQESLATIHGRLDLQDIALHQSHLRQTQIQEAAETVQAMMGSFKETLIQANDTVAIHMQEDTENFNQLNSAVEDLKALLQDHASGTTADEVLAEAVDLIEQQRHYMSDESNDPLI